MTKTKYTTDCLYQSVQIGDIVIIAPPSSGDWLQIAKVIKITPKGIRCEYKSHDGKSVEILRHSFIRINEQLDLARKNKPEMFI